jgi:ABC-type branched-subunit amino acid transport system permease subunit
MLGGSNGIAGVRLPSFAGEPLATLSYVLLLCSVTFLIIWLLLVCSRNNYGRVLLLARDEPEKAEALGHNVKAIKIYAVVVSSVLAALAGALYVPLIGIAYPGLFSVAPNMLVLIWVIIGGRATLLGPFVGALLFKMIEFEAGSRFSNFYMLIMAILFLVTISVLPDGIMSLTRGTTVRPR